MSQMSLHAVAAHVACQVPKQQKNSLDIFLHFTPGRKVAPSGIDRAAGFAVGVKAFPDFITFLGRLGIPASAADLGLLGLPTGPAAHVDGQAGLAVAMVGLGRLKPMELPQGLGLDAYAAGLLAGLAHHAQGLMDGEPTRKAGRAFRDHAKGLPPSFPGRSRFSDGRHALRRAHWTARPAYPLCSTR